MLIVGGLLGTMARNGKTSPFKRVDFSGFKKRLLPNRRASGVPSVVPTQPPVPMMAPQPPMHPLPIGPFNSRPFGLLPMTHNLLPNYYFAKPNEHINLHETYDINPRMPLQIMRRDSSSSSNDNGNECGHVLRCVDAHGKLLRHNPSPSELSKSALR